MATATSISSVAGEGTANKNATLIAVLTSNADGSPIVGATIDFGLSLGGTSTSAGSGTTDANGTAQTVTSLFGVGEGVYSNAVVANFQGDGTFDASNGTGDLTVFAEPAPPPPPPPPPPEPEPIPEPETSSLAPPEPDLSPALPEESTAPGTPASTNPFDGGQIPDAFTTNPSGDAYGQGACVSPFDADECIEPFSGASNLDAYGGGACINPFVGNENLDPFTLESSSTTSTYAPFDVATNIDQVNDAILNGTASLGNLDYSSFEPLEKDVGGISYWPENDAGFSAPDGTIRDFGYSRVEPPENQSINQSYAPEKDASYPPLDTGNYSLSEPPENQSALPPDEVYDEQTPTSQAEQRPDSQDLAAQMANGLYSAQRTVALTMGPVDRLGEPLSGTYYLWSGEADKLAAKEAIAEEGGWTMSVTREHAEAVEEYASALRDEAVTQFPGKSFSNEELFALADSGSLRLPDQQFRAIWDPPSEEIARRAVLGDIPVQRSLVSEPPPSSVQARVEIPTVRAWGLGAAGVMGASGVLTIYATSQAESPEVQGAGAAAGATELTGGLVYGGGAVLTDAELMAIGSGLARFGGGAGVAIVSGYNLVGDIRRGDTAAAAADTAGSLGGVLLAAAPFSGPAAPILAGAGLVLGAYSLGYHLGELINRY